MPLDAFALYQTWQQLREEYFAIQAVALRGLPVSIRHWVALAERLQQAHDAFVAATPLLTR